MNPSRDYVSSMEVREVGEKLNTSPSPLPPPNLPPEDFHWNEVRERESNKVKSTTHCRNKGKSAWV